MRFARQIALVTLIIFGASIQKFSSAAVAAQSSDHLFYIQVSVSYNGSPTACAVTSVGSVTCIGISVPDSLTEAGVALSGVTARKVVDQGGDAYVLLSDGTIEALGTGISKPPIFSDFTDIQSGPCALEASGNIACWGATATSIGAYPSGTYSLLSSSQNTDRCAVSTNNSIVCIGWFDHSYSDVPTFSNRVVAVAAGRNGECAVDSSNLMKCWAQSGFGTRSDVLGVAIGEGGECYLDTSGFAHCEGYGQYASSPWTPPSDPLSSLSIGFFTVCGVLSDGSSIKCWGPQSLEFPALPTEPTGPSVNLPHVSHATPIQTLPLSKVTGLSNIDGQVIASLFEQSPNVISYTPDGTQTNWSTYLNYNVSQSIQVNGRTFVLVNGSWQIAEINNQDGSLLRQFNTCSNPQTLAVIQKLIYISCGYIDHNRIFVLNSDTLEQTAFSFAHTVIEIAEAGGNLVVLQDNGELTIINPNTFSTLLTLQNQTYFATSGKTIWLIDTSSDVLRPLDSSELTFGTSVSVPAGFVPIQLEVPTEHVFIANDAGLVQELNGANGNLIQEIDSGGKIAYAILEMKNYMWISTNDGVSIFNAVPPTVPAAPIVSSPTSPSSGQLNWTWSPGSDGGSPITSYSWSGACAGSGNVTTITCSNLTGGLNYTLTVSATNAVGASDTSSSSLVATSVPASPTVSTPTRPASGQLTWNWSPNSTGGSLITSYNWTGACSGEGNVTSVTCSNLTGGSNYTLTVSATNSVGTSDTSSSSLVATSVPAAPTVSTPTRSASGLLTWNWSPNSTGGSPITSYTWSGACSGSGNVTTTTCSNLTGGSNYTLTVSATNAVGTSDTSSSSLVAYTVPAAPTGLTAQSGLDRSIALSWTAPSQTGGTPILSYSATASPGGRSCTSTGTSCTVSGLTNGQSYTFTVVATNAMGDGAASQISLSATPWSAPVAFGQPSIVPANGQLIASWTPPSDTGGFPITGYTATASPGGKTCSTSGLTCTISGLDQSTSYSVQVVATNSKGLSSQSAPSIQVYAVGATSLKVKTIPFVVQTKTPFLVLAYGAHAGKLVTIAIPGSQGSCTTNVVGQCTASLSVKNPGSYTALAIFGSKSASSSFYAPSITIPLGVKHGKSFTIAIKNAPAKSQVLITLSDGRTKLATTSGAGAASISIPAPKIGLLVVTPSFGGVKLKPSTVLVS